MRNLVLREKIIDKIDEICAYIEKIDEEVKNVNISLEFINNDGVPILTTKINIKK